MSIAETKIRDPGRSRRSILDAAELLFSERSYAGVSLNEIAAAAGLSRAAPSYFFGSKEQLYVAVLERVFAERQEAATRAFEPLVAWARGDERPETLPSALRAAVAGYLGFLVERPAFARLLQWEDLAGGGGLRATPRATNAMRQGLEALRAVAPRRGVRKFDIDNVLFVFVSLTFSPVTQRNTFMSALGRDLADAKVRRRHVDLVADVLVRLVAQPTT